MAWCLTFDPISCKLAFCLLNCGVLTYCTNTQLSVFTSYHLKLNILYWFCLCVTATMSQWFARSFSMTIIFISLIEINWNLQGVYRWQKYFLSFFLYLILFAISELILRFRHYCNWKKKKKNVIFSRITKMYTLNNMLPLVL